MGNVLGMSTGVLRASAQLLLLALSVATLGPVLHGVHDTDCDPVVVLHDESQHHFAAATPDDGGTGSAEHCVACHFLRTSRGPVSWEPNGLQALPSGSLLFHSDGQIFAAPSTSPQPSRAPPLV
jgi:hypothetical protein